MKKWMKKLLVVLMAFTMCFMLLPSSTFADTAEQTEKDETAAEVTVEKASEEKKESTEAAAEEKAEAAGDNAEKTETAAAENTEDAAEKAVVTEAAVSAEKAEVQPCEEEAAAIPDAAGSSKEITVDVEVDIAYTDYWSYGNVSDDQIFWAPMMTLDCEPGPVTVYARPESNGKFLGWINPDQSTNTYVSTSLTYTFTVTGYTYLLARFAKNDEAAEEPDLFTIDFNTNSGTWVEPQNIVSGGKVTEPEAPTRRGYTFKGWYEDSKCTKAYDFEQAVASSFTLYAKWEEEVLASLEIDINNTSAGEVSVDNSDWSSGIWRYEAVGTKITAFARSLEGYEFKRWEDGSGNTLSTEAEYDFTLTADTELKAVFEEITDYVKAEVNLSASALDFHGQVSLDNNRWDYSIGTEVSNGTEVTVWACPHDGYHFVNWTDGTGTVVSTEAVYTFIITKDTSLKAVFEADEDKKDDSKVT